jgi:hypothetical protein
MQEDIERYGRDSFDISLIYLTDNKQEINNLELMATCEEIYAAKRGGHPCYNTIQGNPCYDTRLPYFIQHSQSLPQPAFKHPGHRIHVPKPAELSSTTLHTTLPQAVTPVMSDVIDLTGLTPLPSPLPTSPESPSIISVPATTPSTTSF